MKRRNKEELLYELKDTNFYKLIPIKNNKELYDKIVLEMIKDINEIEIDRTTMELDDFILLAFPYTGKYGLLIHNFELREQYEYCSKLKELFVAGFSETFNLKPFIIEDLLFKSIVLYNNNDMLKEIIKND